MHTSSLWQAPQSTPESQKWVDIEMLRYQIKTEEKIKELEEKYKLLATKSWLEQSNQNLTAAPTMSESGHTDIKISWKFLAQVMPTASLTLKENNGIYWLYTFDTSTTYSTYEDPKLTLRVIALTMNYDTFLRNAKALGKDVYSVNETKTFPHRSFYLNPPKSDTTVRIILEYESQTLAIEISKAKFPILKWLLLKK